MSSALTNKFSYCCVKVMIGFEFALKKKCFISKLQKYRFLLALLVIKKN